ncbi:glycine-rich domain-containing protein [Streptantibioticus rubrisoli]|uniref:Uncharacterized protein n=1 Tax=Streptantibioticus rubrisoli TaxID=1387313 RepID=A0ABT1PI11_9ACTN|nr:hypothetical protein [Streptantibioticus rubrisoli]MCQ4044987.1 hypothetical protein [Streptantibioticus rubrisoli]
MTVVHERPATNARTLLSAELWDSLVEDVRRKHPEMSESLADRGVGQMVGFLVASTRTHLPLSPSKLVDDFWHAFILRTQPYAEFCEHVAGRFIHHNPELTSRIGQGSSEIQLRQTLEAITAAGFAVDPELWPVAAKCTQCHAGCSNSPNSGSGKK